MTKGRSGTCDSVTGCATLANSRRPFTIAVCFVRTVTVDAEGESAGPGLGALNSSTYSRCDALRMAFTELVAWIHQDYGCLRITVVVAKIKKQYLPVAKTAH